MEALSYCQLMERCLAAEARVVELAAENVALKQAAEFATAPDMWIEQADGMLDYRYCDWYVDVLKAAMETPATDRIYAGIKADGVDSGIQTIITMLNHHAPGVIDAINVLSVHSFELREGAK